MKSGKAADSGLVGDGFVEVDRQLDAARARIAALEAGGGVAGVASINGRSGALTLGAEDVGAVADNITGPSITLLIANGLT